MAGENLPLVGKLLGHRRHRTTAGYAHLADAHLVEAAEHVGAPCAVGNWLIWGMSCRGNNFFHPTEMA